MTIKLFPPSTNRKQTTSEIHTHGLFDIIKSNKIQENKTKNKN